MSLQVVLDSLYLLQSNWLLSIGNTCSAKLLLCTACVVTATRLEQWSKDEFQAVIQFLHARNVSTA